MATTTSSSLSPPQQGAVGFVITPQKGVCFDGTAARLFKVMFTSERVRWLIHSVKGVAFGWMYTAMWCAVGGITNVHRVRWTV
ncbi:hypothetical protein Tco_1143902 [Tanacetum coccineum]